MKKGGKASVRKKDLFVKTPTKEISTPKGRFRLLTRREVDLMAGARKALVSSKRKPPKVVPGPSTVWPMVMAVHDSVFVVECSNQQCIAGHGHSVPVGESLLVSSTGCPFCKTGRIEGHQTPFWGWFAFEVKRLGRGDESFRVVRRMAGPFDDGGIAVIELSRTMGLFQPWGASA